jgi:hypothetical protein
MKHTHTVRRLVAAMTESEAIGLKKKRLTMADIDHIVTESETGVDENGNVVYILVKNVIPYEYCKAAYDVAVKAAKQPIAGGSRADAAGAGMELRKRKDGTTSNRFAVPHIPELEGARTVNLGFYNDPACRKTAFTARDWEGFLECLPLTRCVDSVFSEFHPDRYAAQAEAAKRVDPQYVIDKTAFTGVVVNENFPTAVHTDANDLKSGFGALTLLTAGKFAGGQLAFPRYRIAVEFGMGDVLLANVHEPHGNLPIVGVKGEYVRLALIFFFREGMLTACPNK